MNRSVENVVTAIIVILVFFILLGITTKVYEARKMNAYIVARKYKQAAKYAIESRFLTREYFNNAMKKHKEKMEFINKYKDEKK